MTNKGQVFQLGGPGAGKRPLAPCSVGKAVSAVERFHVGRADTALHLLLRSRLGRLRLQTPTVTVVTDAPTGVEMHSAPPPSRPARPPRRPFTSVCRCVAGYTPRTPLWSPLLWLRPSRPALRGFARSSADLRRHRASLPDTVSPLVTCAAAPRPHRVPTDWQEGRGHLLRGAQGPEHQEQQVRGDQVYEEPLRFARAGARASAPASYRVRLVPYGRAR